MAVIVQAGQAASKDAKAAAKEPAAKLAQKIKVRLGLELEWELFSWRADFELVVDFPFGLGSVRVR